MTASTFLRVGPCSRVLSGMIFPDQAMTLAAVDRLVHHATIFEMNVEASDEDTNQS
jgi:hypothetical protein